jgi:hypothetical protein
VGASAIAGVVHAARDRDSHQHLLKPAGERTGRAVGGGAAVALVFPILTLVHPRHASTSAWRCQLYASFIGLPSNVIITGLIEPLAHYAVLDPGNNRRALQPDGMTGVAHLTAPPSKDRQLQESEDRRR